MGMKQNEQSSVGHSQVRKCRINAKSKLILICLLAFIACAVFLRIYLEEDNKAELEPKREPKIAAKQLGASSPEAVPLQVTRDIVRISPHTKGSVTVHEAADGGLVAQYRTCSITFHPDGTASHSSGCIAVESGRKGDGAIRETPVLGRIGTLSLKKNALRAIALKEETGDENIAERNAIAGRLVFENGEIAIISYHLWNPDILTVEALSLTSGETIWTTEHKAVGWPIALSEPPGVYVPTGPRRDSMYYENQYLYGGSAAEGSGDSIVALDPMTGESLAVYLVGTHITSLSTMGGNVFAGTGSGEICVVPESQNGEMFQPPVNTCDIRIETEPVGSIISICSNRAGVSPMTIKNPYPGTYGLRASMGGRSPAMLEVNVEGFTSAELLLPSVLTVATTADRHIESADDTNSPGLGVMTKPVSVHYDEEGKQLRGIYSDTGEVVWYTRKVTEPVAVGSKIVAYTVSLPSIEYLVAHSIHLRHQTHRRKALHKWDQSTPRAIALHESTVCVAEGKGLYVYDSVTNSLVWNIEESVDIDVIYGFIEGTVVLAVSGDLVCRDILTGSESQRFTGFFEPDLPTPSHVMVDGAMYFDSGKALVPIKE